MGFTVGPMERARSIVVLLLVFGWTGIRSASAATLTGSFTPIPRGDAVDLTAEGPLDWVHWGRFTASSVDRKAGVTPRIPPFTPIGRNGPYQYADNFNGYSWSDGGPTSTVTNTTTGVWMWGRSNGFQLDVPAGISTSVLKVYVGTFGAEGKFTADLGGTSLKYSDESISNISNGPGGYYTLTYAADSPDQTLTIKYVVDSVMDPAGNVTLQAAALSAPGVNHPPIVSITSPGDAANFPADGDITLVADAIDTDGRIARVEFFQDDTLLGEAMGNPYTLTWSHVPAGRYTLTARATDDSGSTATSAPGRIFVSRGGGTLSVGFADAPGRVDLDAEGTLDWAHWGLSTSTSFDHKADSQVNISDLTRIGGGDLKQLRDNLTAFSWTGAPPTAPATATPPGVFVYGQGNGFRITAPADGQTRTLKIYVGLYGAGGRLEDYVRHFSAPAYADASLQSVFGNDYAVYSFQYSAAVPAAALVVEYTAGILFDDVFGNVTLQAATLSGPATPVNLPPSVSIDGPTNNETFAAPATIQIDAGASDSDGKVAQVEFFSGATSIGIGAAIGPLYSLVWSNVTAGTYSLTAVAPHDDGGTKTSRPVNGSVIGTAPSEIALAAPSATADSFSFQFSTEPNRTYIVERTVTLTPMDWQPLTNRLGDGGLFTVIDLTPSATQQFYRVRAE